MASSSYILQGGAAGYDRLKVLARVMHPTTSRLLDRAGVAPGMACLDVGSGSGDVTFELARRVGDAPVVGLDLDEVKLDLARREATAAGARNVAFVAGDVQDLDDDGAHDVVYARFLLTHLRDPAAALAKLRAALRPGGIVIVEDIDFTGCICHPRSPAHDRYVELYTRTVEGRGADPNIGLRLPGLLRAAGFEGVRADVVQPVALVGEVKLIPALTMQTMSAAVVAAGFATQAEMDRLVADLLAAAADPGVLTGVARIVQAWARRPA